MATTSSPTSVMTEDSAAGSPVKEGSTPTKRQSMVKRLVGGSFSPSKKSSEKLDDLDDDTTPEIFVNEEEEEVSDDADNIDLSIVRRLLGSSFKLDKDESFRKEDTKTKSERATVSFSGVDSSESSRADDSKSNEELLAKIGRLEVKLKQAQLDYSAEKARRKKSSRSTIKLAKEINKRTVEAAAQQKAIEKVRMNL